MLRERISSPFFLICIAASVALLSYSMARSPVLPLFAKDLGAGPVLIGFIAGASTITGIFVKLPAGALSDVYGRRRLLTIATLFFGLVPFLYLLVHDPLQLLAVRFIHGFATALFSPVATATVAQLYNERRGEKIGWYSSASDFGKTTGPFVGGAILFVTLNNFYLTYAIVGGIGISALLIGLTIKIPEEKKLERARPWAQLSSGVREVASSRPILIAGAMEAAQYLAFGALATFLPIFALGIGLSTVEIGLIFLIQGVVGLVAKPFTGMLSDRIGRKPMIVLGLLLGAVTLAAVPMTTSLVPLMFLTAIFGLSTGIVTPSTTAFVADLSRQARLGTAMGVFGTIWDVGEASGPIIAGIFIASLGSFLYSFGIISVTILVITAVFALAVKDPSRPRSAT